MTNAEKYKTPEERWEAFRKFCGSQGEYHKNGIIWLQCQNCPFRKTNGNCRFKWLDLETDEVVVKSEEVVMTNKEVVMTNEQKCKTPEEKTEVFQKFCNCKKNCSECQAARKNVACNFVWLTLKAEDQEK